MPEHEENVLSPCYTITLIDDRENGPLIHVFLNETDAMCFYRNAIDTLSREHINTSEERSLEDLRLDVEAHRDGWHVIFEKSWIHLNAGTRFHRHQIAHMLRTDKLKRDEVICREYGQDDDWHGVSAEDFKYWDEEGFTDDDISEYETFEL